MTYFALVLFFYHPAMRQFPLVVVAFAILAGSLAATCWWLVSRASRWWVAALVGSCMAGVVATDLYIDYFLE